MIQKEEYLKAKQIIQEYEKQLNISDVIMSLSLDFQVLPGYSNYIKTLHFSPENTKDEIIQKLENMNFL